MTPHPLNILFAGSGEFGLPTLRALVAAGHNVIAVVTQPDRPAGRGRKLTPTPIAAFATEQNLPLIKTADINHEPPVRCDVMVVIAFGQKISAAVANAPRLGSMNLHASLLPKYRGAAPINAAIVNGETIAGNSVIRLAEKMDAGDLLGQSRLTIGETETAGELHDRLSEDGAPLILRVIEELCAGRAIEQPQDASRATLAKKMSRATAAIDWARPAVEIANQIRGLYPWPGCRLALLDGAGKEVARLTPVRARATLTTTGREPGAIDRDGRVVAGDGGVEILEVVPDGKTAMSLSAFKNGRPWREGMRLIPV